MTTWRMPGRRSGRIKQAWIVSISTQIQHTRHTPRFIVASQEASTTSKLNGWVDYLNICIFVGSVSAWQSAVVTRVCCTCSHAIHAHMSMNEANSLFFVSWSLTIQALILSVMHCVCVCVCVCVIVQKLIILWHTRCILRQWGFSFHCQMCADSWIQPFNASECCLRQQQRRKKDGRQTNR